MYPQFYERLYPKCIPTRAIICLMCFTACWTSYMCRLQMPILVVPMMKLESEGEGETSKEAPRERRAVWLDSDSYLDQWVGDRAEAELRTSFGEPTRHVVLPRALNESDPAEFALNRAWKEHDNNNGDNDTVLKRSRRMILFPSEQFVWPSIARGQMLSSYSYGNVPGNFIGGVLAIKYGPRRAVLWTSLLAGAISLISPLVAQIHWGALAFTRVIIGLTGGVTFPACHAMVAKWAPPNEKSRFVWSLLGGTFGTIITYPMVAGIAATINWAAGWYIPAIMMFVWCFFWMLLAYDSPEEHPGITDEEKEYILTAQAGTLQKAKPTMKQTPIRQIFTSVPFIALVICHFGNLWLIFFYQTGMMIFLTKSLKFKLTKGGWIASLPWAGRMLFGFFFSWAGDTIKKRELMSITMLRKGATLFSHLIPGVCLIIVGYLGSSLVLVNVFLVFALGFNGAASISNLSNNQDLSPNFAGFLYGIMNTVGCAAGIILPPMVEEIAGKYNNPVEKWRIIFWIGAAVCLACMVIFLIFGSGKIQSWNEIPKDEEDDKERTDGVAGGATGADGGVKA